MLFGDDYNGSPLLGAPRMMKRHRQNVGLCCTRRWAGKAVSHLRRLHQVLIDVTVLMCRLTNDGNKTRTERKGLPAFSCLVEVLSHTTWRVHPNVAASVDALLANKQPTTQLRQHKDGKLIVRFESPAAPAASALSQHGEPWLTKLFHLARNMHDSPVSK